MNAFSRLSLVHRFLLIGFVILLGGMALIGTWVGRQIESGVISGTGVVTNMYLDGAISPHVQSLAGNEHLDDADRIALDRLLSGTHLGEHIVALKIWGRNGRIIYDSANPAEVGKVYAMERPLASAFAGEVRSRVVEKAELENLFKDDRWSRLIETYTPLRSERDRSVLAVAGFFNTAEGLEQSVRAAQLRSWGVHGAITLAILVLLATLVRAANDTITATQRELNEKVAQLTALLAQNEHLHDRVNRAAARTMALNEQFLRNIATDLHDGPGQGLALASMRIEALSDACGSCEHSVGRGSSVSEEFRTVHIALQSALSDLRAILRGLQLPEIEQLSLVETLQRAADDHRRKTGVTVPLTLSNAPETAPLPVRITLFRVLQESLANGFRHGGGRNQRVAVTGAGGEVSVEVADDGPGFDPKALKADGHFGLDWMRERVELLGGNFEVRSAQGQGAVVRASLPLTQLAYGDG
ncbi:MAG: sensor histidine kinase [Betaproteobacteria bacterium]|nr:MAG: sensor histidine kinase [Betaproteobacteria bacterium]